MKFATTVKAILSRKGSTVRFISPDATVLEALRTMAANDIGAVLVMEGEELRGIFSERDYARKIALEGLTSRDTRVREVMSAPVVSVSPDESVEGCMTVMTEKRIRHLPVMDMDRLIGVISIGDVVKSLLGEQEFVIAQLEDYIMGARG